MRGVGLFPTMVADTVRYLALEPSRPPAYGLLLRLWGGLLRPSLPLLSVAQFGALIATSGMLAFAIGLRCRSALFGLGALGLLWLPEDLRSWARMAMPDAPFTACVMAALAAIIAPWRPGRAVLAAGLAVGAAVALRNAALALTLALALTAVAMARGRGVRVGAALLAAAVLPSVAALAASAAVHLAFNDAATPGGWAGVSLLGKGLMLLRPDATAWLPAPLAALPGEVAPAQAALAGVPGLRLSLRVQHDYHDFLRFVLAWDRLMLLSPNDAAPPEQLARMIATRAIAADPAGYLHLVARDWVSLWAWPDDITAAERARDAAALAGLPPLPYLTAYWSQRDPSLRVLLPVPTLWPKVMLMRALSAVAAIGGIVVLATALWGGARGRECISRGLLFAALAGQGMAASTALIEGGLSRYAMAIWPASVALCVLGAHPACRAAYSAAFGRASVRA